MLTDTHTLTQSNSDHKTKAASSKPKVTLLVDCLKCHHYQQQLPHANVPEKDTVEYLGFVQGYVS